MSNTPSEELRLLLQEARSALWQPANAALCERIDDALARLCTHQPVVREPLTDEQIDALIATKHFREGYELTASVKVCINWYRLGLRDGERAHGITGDGK